MTSNTLNEKFSGATRYVLDDELAGIVNEEIDASMNSVMERQETLELQISDVDSRLEHLYDALEKGSFSSDELAPRIRKLQERKNGLLDKKREIAVEAQPNFLEMPELKVIQGYVENLSSLLASSSIVEKRGFLKSFVNEIIVVDGMITINYRLPMPPENSEEENVAVLPFIQHGRPYRSRTCDTLIKSLLDGVLCSPLTFSLVLFCLPRKSQFVRIVPFCIILFRSFR